MHSSAQQKQPNSLNVMCLVSSTLSPWNSSLEPLIKMTCQVRLPLSILTLQDLKKGPLLPLVFELEMLELNEPWCFLICKSWSLLC